MCMSIELYTGRQICKKHGEKLAELHSTRTLQLVVLLSGHNDSGQCQLAAADCHHTKDVQCYITQCASKHSCAASDDRISRLSLNQTRLPAVSLSPIEDDFFHFLLLKMTKNIGLVS